MTYRVGYFTIRVLCMSLEKYDEICIKDYLTISCAEFSCYLSFLHTLLVSIFLSYCSVFKEEVF